MRLTNLTNPVKLNHILHIIYISNLVYKNKLIQKILENTLKDKQLTKGDGSGKEVYYLTFEEVGGRLKDLKKKFCFRNQSRDDA